MMKEHKESSVYMMPKEHIEYLKEDKGLFEHITYNLSKALADKIIQILDTEGEIAIRKTNLKAEEYQPTNSIEYKSELYWSPMVRCKNCTYFGELCWCNYFNFGVDKNDYCPRGERREE